MFVTVNGCKRSLEGEGKVKLTEHTITYFSFLLTNPGNMYGKDLGHFT